jgi:glycosyltransferase involved in cell wall biosynthesis
MPKKAIPKVSVVVPAHNRARFLEATLDSIRAQTMTDWECVIIDDGSSDDTLAIAEEYARADSRVRVFTKANGGASAARNDGFLHTNPGSLFVTFMDSDDVWLPAALETLLRRVSADPAAVGAHALAETIDQEGRVIEPGSYSDKGRSRLALQGARLLELPLERPTDFSVLVNGNVLFPPGLVLVRREIYEAVGPFDESLNGPEDWDMLIRISRYGHIAFADEVILLYRLHGKNLGSSAWVPRQAWLVRCKAFYSPENTVDQRAIARRGWRAYQRMMVAERVESAAQHVMARQLGRATGMGVRAVAPVYRYVRGYPTPRVTTARLTWDSVPRRAVAVPSRRAG